MQNTAKQNEILNESQQLHQKQSFDNSNQIKEKSNLIQNSENDEAILALMHKPSSEIMSCSLHPIASLFEKSTNIKLAKEAHRNFKEALINKGIKVITIQSIIEQAARNKQTKNQMVELIKQHLTYQLLNDKNEVITDENEIKQIPNNYFLSEEYKVKVLKKLCEKELLAILMTDPVVQLKASKKPTAFQFENMQIKPMGNMVFTRDQQIVTGKGPVLGRMSTPQRQYEVEVIKFIYQLLNVHFFQLPQDSNNKKYRLEGGDYVPDNDIAFIGVGPRTTYDSIAYMLDNDLFGKERVAVVVDEKDLNQDRMHLDTVFNIASPKLCFALEDILNGNYPMRHVDEYQRKVNENGHFQCYDKVQSHLSFQNYLESNGYRIVKVTDEEQKNYLINFINIGKNKILAVHKDVEKKLIQHGINDIEVTYVDYEGIKNMYGAAHCSTQIFRIGSKILFELQ